MHVFYIILQKTRLNLSSMNQPGIVCLLIMLSFVLSNTWDGRYTIKSFLMRLFQSRLYFWLFDGEFVCYVHVHEGCVSVCWKGGGVT